VWATGGVVLGLGSLVFGFLFLVVGLAALAWALWAADSRVEAFGVLAGVGAALLLVAFENRNSIACPASGRIELPAGAERLPGASIECGGMDPTPWFVGGVAAVGLAVVCYALLRRRESPDPVA
jgi:hypothetical protein